ncbi:hypothetical protein ACOBR2_14340 [Telmatobacter bradus]|uniref:hypothetical protein n=1 Tax=Telmatobacter bradus TaxID=474953 RepID=UPI003B43D1B8
MEADWEVEIGGDGPVIEARWAGFIDLRTAPQRIDELEEARKFPPLGEALVALNAPGSPAWSAKCDVWLQLEKDTWDADELDAPADEAFYAAAGYIDLLATEEKAALDEAFCRKLVRALRAEPLTHCRVDLIVRRAWMSTTLPDPATASAPFSTGLTAYLTACGASEESAQNRLANCLRLLAHILQTGSTLQ